MPSKKTGDWAKASVIVKEMKARTKEAAGKAMLQEAHFLRARMVEGITKQAPGGEAFKPLSPLTILARKLAGFRGTKALIRNAFLIGGIQVTKEGNDIFIGIHRTAKDKDGKSLVNVAEVHEKGAGPYVVNITPKMRRFLFGVLFKQKADGGVDKPFWLLKGSGKKTITIRIPARPFIRPVFDKFAKAIDVEKRLEAKMVELLKGTLAK